MGRNLRSSIPVTHRVIAAICAAVLVISSPVWIRVFIGGRRSTSTEVRVETITEGDGPMVSSMNHYSSMVTLYIEHNEKHNTPAGWSTREADGADHDEPFVFQPGVELIEGWTEGVLQMKEGERAWIHVPAAKGYGGRAMGAPGSNYYIPANSDLLFDIEITGQAEPSRHRRNDPHGNGHLRRS